MTVSGRVPSPSRLLPTLILAVVAFQVTLTMVTPALPAIGAGLGADPGALGRAQALYAIAGAVATVALPLSDRFGRRSALLLALATGAAGSLLSALASEPGLFTAGRVLQGIGVIALPLATLVIHRHVPEQRFGRALGWLGMVSLGVSGADTLLAGWLADTYGHRVLFWIMLAVQIVAAVAVAWVLPAETLDRTVRPDAIGMTVLALGVASLLTGISFSQSSGWTSPLVLGAFLIGLLLLAVFPAVERRVERRGRHPLIRLRHLRSRSTWPLLLVPVFGMGALAGLAYFIVPLYAQHPRGLGLSALEYALFIGVPAAVLVVPCAPLAGMLAPRIGWTRVLVLGVAVMTVAAIALTATLPILIAVIVFAAPLGACFFGVTGTAANGLSVLLSPQENPAFLPGMLQCSIAVGGAVGFSVAASVLTGLGTGQVAFTVAAGVLAGMAALAVIAATLVPSPETAPSQAAPAR
ncbi:MFS transporter [Nonomuraea typhae]|uniref:MFS transporter n=1 Tax=Nonomuraea typhae TaxID=2603600 RepID=UPI0012F7AEF0|nr:MFS transporter [Nonomuraea typhae]